MEGADNTRDLGGLAVARGGRTRFRRLLRAGTLQDLTAGDVAHLTEDLDVRKVVDLRLTDEAAREGSALSRISAVPFFSPPGFSAGKRPVRKSADRRAKCRRSPLFPRAGTSTS